MSATCETCGARIHWALTPKGERVPINREASARGNVLLLRPTALDGNLMAVTLSGHALKLAQGRYVLFTKHSPTCRRTGGWREEIDERRAASVAPPMSERLVGDLD